ncbi:Phosphatidylinositol 4-phosphate 5-kinase type-1 beta [Seminavis robusta]|uniref:Phosphatidylinositol 4-phosphate 5-kinase type-1 beta n=1 Tax=Seminavis robusta TaxID=568900 RepID=A0A9N8EFX3_9STRA|nr:Phosphatidylinositol 4-phosphate 5-kinase type-1 beta [Seminavis robusta]|eukprot:Sro1098_g240990.1 Phosphatidylinositol 4-phosphate 5-kinase type-1 beta (647) ;mRNA; f:21174-23316
MIGIDSLLSVAASATAVIASLQAASRAKYLVEHQEIGVKQGPLILPPSTYNTSTTTSSTDELVLWDLVQVFQQSVQLGLQEPTLVFKDCTIHTDALEHLLQIGKQQDPYSLSPYAYQAATATDASTTSSPKNDNHQEDPNKLNQLVVSKDQDDNDDTTKDNDNDSIHVLDGVMDHIQQSTNYWTKRLWHWRKSKQQFQHYQKQSTTTSSSKEEGDEGDANVAISKHTQHVRHNNNNTSFQAEITAYAPQLFANLRREQFLISDESFQRSIFESGPYISFQSNSKGAARVGGVFFFTRDGAYMIKTIKQGEAETFLKMLPKYYKHMKRHARHSLLTRFCGMYTVQIRDPAANELQKHTFVIMNSVFPAEASNFISEMYDLKGSTVGRACSQEEKAKKGPNAVLKDLDLAREVELVKQSKFTTRDNRDKTTTSNHNSNNNYGIHLGASAKSKLLGQLRKDVALLQECRVMDYSLLVGIVNMDQQQPQQQSSPVRIIDASNVNNNTMEEVLSDHPEQKPKGISLSQRLFRSVMTPVRLMMAPPLFFSKKLYAGSQRTLSTVLTYPLPHYGSSVCVVDGGVLSILYGTRSGKRAIYYLGLIDFLQPWTTRKVVEKQLKGWLLRQDTHAISCVDPDEYATRFLDFIEAHVS